MIFERFWHVPALVLLAVFIIMAHFRSQLSLSNADPDQYRRASCASCRATLRAVLLQRLTLLLRYSLKILSLKILSESLKILSLKILSLKILSLS